MKNLLKISLVLAGASVFTVAHADVTLNVPGMPGAQLTVEQMPINEGATSEMSVVTLDLAGTAVFNQAAFPAMISIAAENSPIVNYVFSNGASDKITVDVTPDGSVQITGTPQAEGVAKVEAMLLPYRQQFAELSELYNTNPEEAVKLLDALTEECNKALADYFKANPSAPEAQYALLLVDGQDYLDCFAMLPEDAVTSAFYPSVAQKKASQEKQVEAERKLAELECGTTPAPAFTLPDLAGKQVSLSDFKGKWVVLDFWGSWCRWCIKGFPELKELHQKYGDKLAIVGVDCRDSDERWREAVKKYELPWVNVYNDCSGDTNALLEAYAVQGFPTKVIVNPQGIICKIVVGADPAFPSILASFIGE